MTKLTTRQEIGLRIKARRELLRLNQGELAKAFGVAQSTMSQYENGERGIEAAELSRLAQIMSVPESYFYGEDDIEGPIINDYYEGLPPAKKSTADEVIKALWLEAQREETTHGKKAE